MGLDRMEPGASANAPPSMDLPPLKDPATKQTDWQTLQEHAVRNRRPGQVLPLHAINNLTPRKEFLTSQCSFAHKRSPVNSQAYLDTLSSFSFVTPQLLRRIQESDTRGTTWRTTQEFVEFGVAVGSNIHKAPIVNLQIKIDSFCVWHEFGIAPIQEFECILGSDFSNAYLQVLNWQQRKMVLLDSAGKRHTVHGDGKFIQARRLDLVVPAAEVRKAVRTPGCLYLIVQPQDARWELETEEQELQLEKSQLSSQVTLTIQEQQRLQDLLDSYEDCFQPRKEPPTERVPGENFSIPLQPGTSPQFTQYYRLSPSEREELRKLIAEYVDAGKMDICAGSAWGAPVILVPKKDGGWRVVFDYRKLNNVAIKDRYPLPRIDDFLQGLGGSQFFSAMDALDGFHQLPMNPEDIHKTAVQTPFGSYTWRVMPMGVANAPAAFQRMMNRIFGHLTFAKVYVDDILIHSNSKEAHFQHLEELLQVCRTADIRLKRSKCHFFCTTLDWVGFRIENQELRCSPQKLNKIQHFPKPRTQKENMAFLGLCQFYLRIVPRYSDIAAPLTELNKKKYAHDFQRYWMEQHDQAFQQLVEHLTTAPALVLFNEDRPTRVETDASSIGMGAVLQQEIAPGEWRPVEYWSRKFNAAQRNYHAAERETCAIVYALAHWKHLLFGCPFTVITDNTASKYLTTKSVQQLSPRDARWIEKLAYYAPFSVEYRPGKENVGADYFSRHPVNDAAVPIRTMTILDLCAGMGTTLRALELAIPEDAALTINYIAVEQDPDCRAVIQRVFNSVHLARPGLFVREDIFRYGNDVRTLAHRRKLPAVDLLIAGVPCQPFSRANTSTTDPPLGLRDARELFTVIRDIRTRIPTEHSYIVECTPFAAHLQKDLERISEWLGEPQEHNMADYSAQQRIRLCWTNLPPPKPDPELLATVPLMWQDCLEEGSTPPLDSRGLPRLKCPTLMASANSHSDRSRTTWVVGEDKLLRELTIHEREKLVGMQPEDTAGHKITPAARRRMCGNAFPVGWLAVLIADMHKLWNRTLLGTRSADNTTCGSVNAIRTQRSLSNDNGSAAHITKIPLLSRIRSAILNDKDYQDKLKHPPAGYICRDGLLFRDNARSPLGHYAGPAILQAPLDNALRQDMLHLVHDRAHFGAHRTYETARRHFYWPGMKAHIKQFVARCPTCQRMKPTNTSRARPQLPEMRYYPHPFHTIVLDVVEGLPLTPDHHNAVITVVDRLTKFAVYIPMHTSWSATRQARALLDNVVYKYHTPTIIHTDNGPAYRKLFGAYCTALGSSHKTGTPYHSQSQGPVERQHRTLLQTLRTMTEKPENWDQYLQAAAHAYNDSVHSLLERSPFEMLYGCPSRLPWHLQLVTTGTETRNLLTSPNKMVTGLLTAQRKVYSAIQDLLVDHAKQQAASTQHLPTRTFKPGDWVKLQYGLKDTQDRPKLEPYYEGPYCIEKALGNDAYSLVLPPGTRFQNRFHVDRLLPWIDSDLSLFPLDHPIQPLDNLPTSVQETTMDRWPVARYLVRDFSQFPAKAVRYWVRGHDQQTCWIDEDATILDEILDLEETNGCLPECGIDKRNRHAVEQHKQDAYLLTPNPVLQDTWTWTSMPYSTRQRQTWQPPTKLSGSVVMDAFEVDQGVQYYQGIVQSDGRTIVWTDGYKTCHTAAEIRSMLYNPVAVAYS